MKINRYILSAAALWLTTGTLSAITSPFQGNPAGEGVYYLYNVESGLWLQNNDRRIEHYTTRAELDGRGFDITVIAEGDGYRLNPRFGGNHSINGGENLYMDTNDAVTIWHFKPVDNPDVPNAYTIESASGKLGLGSNGYLTGQATENTTWQLVSKAERLATLSGASEDKPVDVTWLVDCPNFGMNDERYSSWNARFEGGANSRGGHDKVHCNTVHESWNSNVIDMSQTITGIPDGTYRVSVQGYYRDGDGMAKFENGTEVLRSRYFANDVSQPLMSTFAGGADARDDNHDLGAGGKWAPNSMNNASVAFFNGEYCNSPLVVMVENGTLTIGISKPSSDGVQADWTVFDNWKVEYLGEGLQITGLRNDLKAAIAEATEYSTKGTEAMNSDLKAAIAEATLLLDSTDANAIINATEALKAKTESVKRAAAIIVIIGKTIEVANGENPEGRYAEAVDNATAALKEAVTYNQLSNSLQALRIARKSNAADKQENMYEGSEAKAGEYYLYNVGQKQFFCGGSDWGAHAALGFPGIPVKLEANGRNAFSIRTGLDNGGGDWLNYNGYCDTPDRNQWTFKAVDGKPHTYNIIQKSNSSLCLAYNPYSLTDAGEGTYYYSTVGASENIQDSEDAQWILVTKEERDNLIADASPENPVDVSYMICMPNFSQREYGNTAWDQDNGVWAHNLGTIDGRGSRRDDFVFSVSDADQAFEITQTLTDMPAGQYRLSAQAFYRGASRSDVESMQPGSDMPRHALLYANEQETEIPSITEAADMAPGLGWQTALGELPDGCVSAAEYFQNGLYKTFVDVTVGEDGILYFGAIKEKTVKDDWLALDNFRLTYMGNDGSSAISGVSADKTFDTRIFNLQGIEVKAPLTPGIYIRGGRKFIIR